MCYNCGCHMPDDDMGDPDNITNDTFKALAKRSGINLGELKHSLHHYLEDPSAKKNPEFEEMFKKASRAWGQSVKEAKKQTYNLLKSEI